MDLLCKTFINYTKTSSLVYNFLLKIFQYFPDRIGTYLGMHSGMDRGSNFGGQPMGLPGGPGQLSGQMAGYPSMLCDK